MSVVKLIKSFVNIFQKKVITFLVVRRHDLSTADKFTYLAVKRSFTTRDIRFKLWHFLNLPDYSHEEIKLFNEKGQELSLKELKRGNNPQAPFFLEIWPRMLDETLMLNAAGDNNDVRTLYINDDVDNQEPYKLVKEKEEKSESIIQLLEGLINSETQIQLLPSKISKQVLAVAMEGKAKMDEYTTQFNKLQSELQNVKVKLYEIETKLSE